MAKETEADVRAAHQQREHQKLAANLPKNDAERDNMKNIATYAAMNSLNFPAYAATADRVAMAAPRLIVVESDVPDATDLVTDKSDTEGFGKPKPLTDRGRKMLRVAHVRVANPDGSPRMIPSKHGGAPEYFPIEDLLREMHESTPGFRWKLGTI